MENGIKKYDIYFSVNDFGEINIISVKDKNFYTLYDISKDSLNEIQLGLENPEYKMGLYTAKLVCQPIKSNYQDDDYDVEYTLENIKIAHYL